MWASSRRRRRPRPWCEAQHDTQKIPQQPHTEGERNDGEMKKRKIYTLSRLSLFYLPFSGGRSCKAGAASLSASVPKVYFSNARLPPRHAECRPFSALVETKSYLKKKPNTNTHCQCLKLFAFASVLPHPKGPRIVAWEEGEERMLCVPSSLLLLTPNTYAPKWPRGPRTRRRKKKRGYPAERCRSKAHAPQEAVILYKYNARKEEERHPAPHTRALRPVASLPGPIAKLPCA